MSMSPEKLKEKLTQKYQDGSVTVIDLTGTHDHYEVHVESKQFAGLSRIQAHQHVMATFADELKTGEVHALSIKTKIL